MWIWMTLIAIGCFISFDLEENATKDSIIVKLISSVFTGAVGGFVLWLVLGVFVTSFDSLVLDGKIPRSPVCVEIQELAMLDMEHYTETAYDVMNKQCIRFVHDGEKQLHLLSTVTVYTGANKACVEVYRDEPEKSIWTYLFYVPPKRGSYVIYTPEKEVTGEFLLKGIPADMQS